MWIVIIGIIAGLGFLAILFTILSKIIRSKDKDEGNRNSLLLIILLLIVTNLSTLIENNKTRFDYILLSFSFIMFVVLFIVYIKSKKEA